jgi:hypothetical protein
MLSKFKGSLLGLAAILVLPVAASAGLVGSYVCSGNVTFSFVPTGSTQPQTVTESEVLQLDVDGTTGNVSGTLFFNDGETCVLPITGSSSVGTKGIGNLSVTFQANAKDEDGDFACGLFYGAMQGTITQNFHIVLALQGFYFIGRDDFISPNSSDNSDFFASSGVCDPQLGNGKFS